MTWLGVPFAFNLDSINQTLLSVGQIPTVHVDTGFGWDTLFGSIVAGAIPAFIAWYAIKKNLSALEQDRVNQQSTFDKDRNAQLDIAAKNLNAQVLSVNRQQWINSLRDTTAEYIAAVQLLRKSRIIARHCAHLAKKNGSDFYIEYRHEITAMTSDAKNVDNLNYKIRLLINPSEPEGIKITELLDTIRKNSGSFQKKPDRAIIAASAEELVTVMQSYIKKEWDRVKKFI